MAKRVVHSLHNSHRATSIILSDPNSEKRNSLYKNILPLVLCKLNNKMTFDHHIWPERYAEWPLRLLRPWSSVPLHFWWAALMQWKIWVQSILCSHLWLSVFDWDQTFLMCISSWLWNLFMCWDLFVMSCRLARSWSWAYLEDRGSF